MITSSSERCVESSGLTTDGYPLFLSAQLHSSMWKRLDRVELLSQVEGAALGVSNRAGEDGHNNATECFLHGGRLTQSSTLRRQRNYPETRSTPEPSTTLVPAVRATLYSLKIQRDASDSSKRLMTVEATVLYNPATTDSVAGGSSSSSSISADSTEGPALWDHVLFTRGPLLFLHGGRDASGRVSRQLHLYHLERRCWIAMGPERFGGVAAPRMCGHAVTSLNRKGSAFLLVGVEHECRNRLVGQKRGRAEAGLSVFQLDLQRVWWVEVKTSGAGPGPRSHFSLTAPHWCGSATKAEPDPDHEDEEVDPVHQEVFLAGGERNGVDRLDIWQLNLTTGIWREIDLQAVLSPHLSSSLRLGLRQFQAMDRKGSRTTAPPFLVFLIPAVGPEPVVQRRMPGQAVMLFTRPTSSYLKLSRSEEAFSLLFQRDTFIPWITGKSPKTELLCSPLSAAGFKSQSQTSQTSSAVKVQSVPYSKPGNGNFFFLFDDGFHDQLVGFTRNGTVNILPSEVAPKHQEEGAA